VPQKAAPTSHHPYWEQHWPEGQTYPLVPPQVPLGSIVPVGAVVLPEEVFEAEGETDGATDGATDGETEAEGVDDFVPETVAEADLVPVAELGFDEVADAVADEDEPLTAALPLYQLAGSSPRH